MALYRTVPANRTILVHRLFLVESPADLGHAANNIECVITSASAPNGVIV